MIAEAIILGTGAIVVSSIWLADRVMQRYTTQRSWPSRPMRSATSDDFEDLAFDYRKRARVRTLVQLLSALEPILTPEEHELVEHELVDRAVRAQLESERTGTSIPGRVVVGSGKKAP